MNWKTHQVSDRDLQNLISHNEPIPVNSGILVPNSGVELRTLTGNMINAVYDGNMKAIRQLNSYNPEYKAMPNRDLLLYNDHLLNPDVNTIVVDGFFGTGKTSTACSHLVHGLKGELDGKKGIKMAYIAKPHESLGKGHGHLPGGLDDKTVHEFKSFTQYFDRFIQPGFANVLKGIAPYRGTTIDPMLEILTFEYLRGRDIEEGWVILDEAQNTDYNEMSGFISRPNDSAKMIILGDTTPTQFDKKGNSRDQNGLDLAKETFQGKKYAGYIELQTIKHILRGQRAKDLFLTLRSKL